MGSTGQRIDLSIVEVALYFDKEISRSLTAAAVDVVDNTPASRRGTRDSESSDGTPSAGRQPPPAVSMRRAIPVILLSNDNGQVAAARSHGLPAFKLGAGEFEARLMQALSANSDITSSGELGSGLRLRSSEWLEPESPNKERA